MFVEFRVKHLFRTYVEVHEPIELSFGMMCGVSLGICVLDGVNVPQWEKGIMGSFCLHLFQLHKSLLFAQKCIQLLHEKLRIFPYGQYSIGICISLAFQRYTQVQGRCWVY